MRAVSNLYLSRPVGPQNQPLFFNAVAALDVALGDDPIASALGLLAVCKSVEGTLGRRPRERWGPREIDLDILVFGRHRIHVGVPPQDEGTGPRGWAERATGGDVSTPPWLVVPHPEAHRRLFVVAPLADLAPRLVPPGWHETVGTAAKRLAASEPGSVTRIARWLGSGWAPIAEPLLEPLLESGSADPLGGPSARV